MANKNGTLEARIEPEDFNIELTNPQNHDPDHFCYIVHAINPVAKNGLLLFAIGQNGYDFKQEIDLLHEPELVMRGIPAHAPKAAGL